MDSTEIENDESEETELDEDDEEQEPEPRRKKRGSDLVRLTGKSQYHSKSKRTTPKGKRRSKKDDMVITASDDNGSRRIIPATHEPKNRGYPKKKTPELKVALEKKISMEMVPDSAGEARDVWIISSDNE